MWHTCSYGWVFTAVRVLAGSIVRFYLVDVKVLLL